MIFNWTPNTPFQPRIPICDFERTRHLGRSGKFVGFPTKAACVISGPFACISLLLILTNMQALPFVGHPGPKKWDEFLWRVRRVDFGVLTPYTQVNARETITARIYIRFPDKRWWQGRTRQRENAGTVSCSDVRIDDRPPTGRRVRWRIGVKTRSGPRGSR